MIASFLIVGALVVAATAAQAVRRRRLVLLVGRRGPALAPALLASFWLTGIWLGQFTGSLVGMALVGDLPLLALALYARGRFPLMRVKPRILTRIDLAVVIYVAAVVLMIDLFDIDCHRAVVGQFLRGNVPPTALNDPRFPLAYHSLYDAVTALVVRALPMQLETALDVVTIGCVALMMANLGVVTRLLFRSKTVGQLGRVFFVVGFGPVIIRMLLEHGDFDALHGRTTQAFVDIILRRPTALGFMFFTMILAFLLPLYRRDPRAPAPRADRSVYLLLPSVALLPHLAEEMVLFVVVLAAPLIVKGRLPWRLVALAVLVFGVTASQSGVVQGLFGHASMATPHLGISWPPMLPSWKHANDGMPIFSRDGVLFFLLELGPVFLLTWALALTGRDARRRVLAVGFLIGLAVAGLNRMDGWSKADADRFIFYGSAPLFMLSAGIVELLARLPRRRVLDERRLRRWSLIFGLVVCTPTVIFPVWTGLSFWEGAFDNNGTGTNLRRNLRAVGPREAVITTANRANEVVQSGFIVVAPMTGSSLGVVNTDHLNDYVRDHAATARWLFLPQNDDRVRGRPVQGRDGDYVLVRAPDSGR